VLWRQGHRGFSVLPALANFEIARLRAVLQNWVEPKDFWSRGDRLGLN
jgi:hypothetical protein